MMLRYLLIAVAVCLAGCAALTRNVNPPITEIHPSEGYRFLTREAKRPVNNDKDTLVVLTFSGGGTRAAAFAYGVLEALRRTEITLASGRRGRLIDGVDIITGVSGGSFTALAYGLYGEKLFDTYEKRFLKRNVESALVHGVLNPANWYSLSSDVWGRSEMAAQYYDEILFDGATFADLERASGPFIMVQTTDISTGSRFAFTQAAFDLICSDLSKVRLARAAAASSAVPLVLSPITLNNYGGTCNFKYPEWLVMAADPDNPARPAARAIKRMEETLAYQDSKSRPYLHLVDGGLADNLGMRAVLEALEEMEAVRLRGGKTPLDNVKRIIVIVVNSLSVPKTNWDQSERPPGNIDILIKATGVPIDRYSYETIELLRDIMARWALMRAIRDSAAFDRTKDPRLSGLINAPAARLYAIDVSFAALKDPKEFEYLNDLPTSFSLTDEQVDRLRAAAGRILLESPDFQKLMKEAGARIVPAN
jgi:NTE family protein